MRVTSVDMFSSKGDLIATFSFRDPTSQNPYIVRGIVGLDADEIVSRFYGLSASKAKFYGLTIESRDVVLAIVLNPKYTNETVSDLRDALYKAIAASRTGMVELRFNDGLNPWAHVKGFVKKFEVAHFAETPEVRLTIECDDPMLRGMVPVDALEDSSPRSAATIVDAYSTAPHGFQFEIQFTQPSPEFLIRDKAVNPEWSFKVTPGTIGATTGFITFDRLYFSSEYGNKYLYLVRGGVTTHLVDKIEKGSIWPILFPGDNFFDSADEEFTWDVVTYLPAYWGV